MARPRPIPTDHKALAALPVRMITVGPAQEQMAVHVSGTLGPGRTPVVCVAGYNRNMADWSDFMRLAAQTLDESTPFVLVDLKGRGRSTDRARAVAYSSLTDAGDLVEIARALAIERAVFVGQRGGQVLMAPRRAASVADCGHRAHRRRAGVGLARPRVAARNASIPWRARRGEPQAHAGAA